VRSGSDATNHNTRTDVMLATHKRSDHLQSVFGARRTTPMEVGISESQREQIQLHSCWLRVDFVVALARKTDGKPDTLGRGSRHLGGRSLLGFEVAGSLKQVIRWEVPRGSSS
jgi:hypothetical protein